MEKKDIRACLFHDVTASHLSYVEQNGRRTLGGSGKMNKLVVAPPQHAKAAV